jgi:cytochrome b involved in lipid metabolism
MIYVIVIAFSLITGFIIYKQEQKHKLTLEVINGYDIVMESIKDKEYDIINYYRELYNETECIVDDEYRETLNTYIKVALKEIDNNNEKVNP